MKKLQTFIDLNEKRGAKEKCKDDFTIGKDGFLFAELEEKWKIEYNARTSAEPSNKPEKLDFKLEDGRHLSTKMWYCHTFQCSVPILLAIINLNSERLFFYNLL